MKRKMLNLVIVFFTFVVTVLVTTIVDTDAIGHATGYYDEGIAERGA